jgi:predicted Rossmann-fold nucleotide-binding protein
VYCGAGAGNNPEHIEAARQLGRAMAANNIDLGESLAVALLRSSSSIY